MNYDVWGSWSTGVGPNAPLNDTCAPPEAQQGSAVSAIKAWHSAGMPRSKIVLGVPAYGHSFSVAPQDAFVQGSTTELAAYPAFNKTNQPAGDRWDDGAGTEDVCGVVQGAGGTFTIWGMTEGGFLNANGDPAEGILYRYDECSQTVRPTIVSTYFNHRLT
jgi:chitinase